MDPKILSALIAGIVSLIVSLGTIWATRFRAVTEKERQERELQRRLTEKLYEKRMQAYPAVFIVTRKLNSHLKNKEKLTTEKLNNISDSLSEWVYGDASFFLSPASMKAYYKLRDALEVEVGSGSGYLKMHRRNIWEAKNAFHSSLKKDLRLLFGEDLET